MIRDFFRNLGVVEGENGVFQKKMRAGGKTWLTKLGEQKEGWLIKLISWLKRSSVPNVPRLKMTRMETV